MLSCVSHQVLFPSFLMMMFLQFAPVTLRGLKKSDRLQYRTACMVMHRTCSIRLSTLVSGPIVGRSNHLQGPVRIGPCS